MQSKTQTLIITTIAELLGSRVAEIVAGCAESKENPKPPKQVRRLRYLKQIQVGSAAIALVSACDKADNLADFLRSARANDGIFSSKTQSGTITFYSQLLPNYRQKLSSTVPDLLQDLLDGYEQLKEIWG